MFKNYKIRKKVAEDKSQEWTKLTDICWIGV